MKEKREKFIQKMIDFIKKILLGSNGTLLPHNPSFPREIEAYGNELLSDFENSDPDIDKRKMRSDFKKVSSDSKKAYNRYDKYCLNG